MLRQGVNQRGRSLAVMLGCVPLSLLLLFGLVSYGQSQQVGDLDQDGIPDHRDLDQDNDGLLNSTEGYQVLSAPSLQEIDTYRLAAAEYPAIVTGGQLAGARYHFDIIDNETAEPMQLHATILSGSTSLNWSVHQSLPKIQLESPGHTMVNWEIVERETDISRSINSELTISDLDSERQEQITVSMQSLIGYSLQNNSAMVVTESSDGQLTFTASTDAEGQHATEAVTLHLREQEEVRIEYQSSENTDPVSGLKNNRAGFRHNLNPVSSLNYFPLPQQRDTDGDGVADHRDLDSDNDGVSDIIEAGGIDLNLDGVADGDVDDNGIPLASGNGLLAPDNNADGIADPYDFSVFAEAPAQNTEVVDAPVAAVLDHDQDGLTDAQELRLGTNPHNPDTDGDGVSDSEEVMIFHTDPLTSAVEPVSTDAGSIQPDSDNDGIADTLESLMDHDGDGVPNLYDLDSDNDGIADVIEARLVDTTADGLVDEVATDLQQQPPDFDGDGVADFLDTDSDEDGLFDLIESGGTDADNNGYIDAFTDANGDGWDDRYLNTAFTAIDDNNNGQADHLEPLVLPQETPQNDAPLIAAANSAQLNTGLRGNGGCVFYAGASSVDAGMLSLLLFSILSIGFRQSRGRSNRV